MPSNANIYGRAEHEGDPMVPQQGFCSYPARTRAGKTMTIDQNNYEDVVALNYSGMKHLAVSPLRFWHLKLNPLREPIEPTKAMTFGSALHCKVFEPSKFESRFYTELERPEDALGTISDIRDWIVDRGGSPKGTMRAQLIDQAKKINPSVRIWEELQASHKTKNQGKEFLDAEMIANLDNCEQALMQSERVVQILSNGVAEKRYEAEIDGCPMKARLDWVTPKMIVDLKTFTQTKGKSIDKTVADAIKYEKYHWQAWVYHTLRKAVEPGWDGPHVLIFVESEPPHEIRIKVLSPKLGGNVAVYWETARLECTHLMRTYVDYMDRYGLNPWRDQPKMVQLTDEDIQLY